MDELDLLLEELAIHQQSPGPENVPENTFSTGELLLASGYSALAAKERVRSKSPNVYSELPAPVEASLDLNKDLDSILDDMLALGSPQDHSRGPLTPPSSSAPPPLAPKLSVKKKTSGGLRDHDSPRAGTNVTGPATPSRKTDTIDDLLGGLSSDLAKIGVHTVAKGHCASCRKLITGKMITALGSTWHPEHFVCTQCETELGTGGFFERDGRAYCEKDYHGLFSPRCAYCKGPILQNILTALDQSWHPDHFFCAHCGDRFGPEGFLEKDGKPYCNKDFYLLFAPKCSGCGDPVRENYLNAANGTWHAECFVCADCLKPFTDGCFMEMNGRPLCSLHFHTRQGTLCGSCGEPITGRCISAMDRKFHPEHFVCAFCLRQLSQGVFKEEKQKPYCSACHSRLFE